MRVEPERVHRITFEWMPLVLFLFIAAWCAWLTLDKSKDRERVKAMRQQYINSRDSIAVIIVAKQDSILTLLREK